MNPKVITATIVSIILITGLGIFVTSQKPAATQYTHIDEFAQCLSAKKITMYGAVWCSHCQAQKKLFGDSFKYISYVECPDNPQKCLDAKVNGYPTWIFPDGSRLEGEQKLEDIARLSQCPLR